MAQYIATFPSPRQHKLVLTVTEGVRNLSTRQVQIKWVLEVVKGVNWQTWTNVDAPDQPWEIVLGGITVASGNGFSFNFAPSVRDGLDPSPNGRATIDSGSRYFDYEDDGSLSLSVAFSADADVREGGDLVMGEASYPSSGTVYFDPAPISVASTVSVKPRSANVGESVVVSLVRKSASYTHRITWVSGSMSGTIQAAGFTGTSTSWTVPDVTDEFPSQAQSPITITATTYDASDNIIGSRSTVLLVWNVAPTLDPTSPTPFDMRVRRVRWHSGAGQLRAVNPILTGAMKLTDSLSATPTLEFTTTGIVPGSETDLEGALVLLDIQNGASWQSTGLLFTMSRVEGDDNEPTDTEKWAGIAYLDFLMARAYQQRDWSRKGSDTSAGRIMGQLFATGHDQGWGPNVATSFPALTLTTLGDNWLTSGVTREISGGTPYSQILQAFVNDGWAEYRSRYNDTDGICYLDMWNPGTGSDWSSSAAQVTVNFATAKISEAPTTWSLEGVLDRVYALGDAPKSGSLETLASTERSPYNAEEYGVLEGWVSAAGQTTGDAVREVAKNALDNATETKSRQFTYSAFAVSRNLLPYYTFKPGDWILVPANRERDASPVSERVAQVVLDKTADGDINVTVICGDLIPAGATASIMKRIKASTGGRISGGTLKDPIPLQSIIPAPPEFATEEAAVSVGYWNSNGEPRSYITFEWEPVTTALDEVTPLDIDYYEVWWRPNPGVEWALKTSSVTTSIEMNDWAVGMDVQLQVRARSSAGAFGAFSAWDEVTTVAPTSSIPALGVAALYTDGLGNIFADWDGNLGDTSLVPSYFAYMNAEISPDNGSDAPTGVWEVKGNSLPSAGTITFNPGSFGKWWVRFRAYDLLGGPGVNGTPDSITTVDPGLVPPPTPLAPTGLTATAGAGWDALGGSSGDYIAVEWSAVTLDTESDAVTIAYYEVEGDNGSGDWVNVLRITGLEFNLPVERGSTWEYRVRAISDLGGVSDWSSTAGPETADSSITPLEPPSVPSTTSSKGLLYVEWDGLDENADDYPNDSGIRYAYVETAPDATGSPGTWTRSGTAFPGRAGTAIISGLTVDGEYYARIVVVDGLGVEVSGNESAITPILGVQGSDIDAGTIGGSNLDPDFANGATITGARFQTDAADDTGVKMTSNGIAAYDSAGDPTFLLDAASGSVWFGTGTISGDAIDVSTIDVGLLQASLITNGMGDALTIGGTSLVSIISGIQTEVGDNSSNLATYFDFGADGQWKTDDDSEVTGLRIASTSDSDAFNTFAFSGGFQIRRGSTALAWWEADPDSPSLVRFVTPNITVLNDLNVGSHKLRPGSAGVTILSAQ